MAALLRDLAEADVAVLGIPLIYTTNRSGTRLVRARCARLSQSGVGG